MKIFFTNIFLLFFLSVKLFAQQQNNTDRGISESYIILNLNGSGTTYYDLQANTGNPDFGGNLGDFGSNCSLILDGGQNKTYKCNGCNILNGALFYAIYPSGGSAPAFTGVGLPFSSNDAGGCGGNQTWQATGQNINVLNGLSAGTYVLEIYTQANFDGCGTGSLYSSNNGLNYKATFTVLSAPTLSANTSVCSGNSVTLTGACTNGTPLWSTGGIGNSISVSPIIATTYTAKCKSGACESATSSSVMVSVNKVTITAHPVSQFDCESNSVRFLAGATTTSTGGGSVITYQWQRQLPSESTFSTISNGGVFNISGNVLQVAPTGSPNISGTQFRFIATDGNGCAIISNAGTLTLNDVGTISNTAVCENTNYSLTVPISATVLANVVGYQWEVLDVVSNTWGNVTNGGSISGSTLQTLSFTNIPFSQDGKKYRCRVTFNVSANNDNDGSINTGAATTCPRTTAEITLNVKQIPPVPTINTSSPQTACLGSSITLNSTGCSAAGGTTSWYESGIVISTNAIYTFTPSTVSSKTYKATCTKLSCESGFSTNIVVDINPVPIAPPISINPVSAIVCEGASVILTATKEVSANTLRWYKQAIGGSSVSTAVSRNVPNAEVIPADPNTSGSVNYWTEQQNSFGCVSLRTPSSFTVKPNTKLVSSPITQTICETSPVTFTVVVTGDNLSYQWKKGTTNVGTNSSNFTIPSVSITDAGSYSCVVTGSCGTVTSNAATLNINLLTNITTQPIAQIVCEGTTNVSFSVAAVGTNLSYQWKKGTTNVGSNSSTYTIPTVALTDAANYSCVVTGACNTQTSSVVALTVNAKPAIPNVFTPINYCQNSATIALMASPTSTNVLLWYGTNATGGVSSTSAPTPNSATLGTTSYYVSQISTANCESQRTKIDVVINAIPSAPVTTTAISYCKNATSLVLSASFTSGNSLIWYDGNDNVLASAPTPTTNIVGVQTYKVSQKTPSPALCESPKSIITITINDLPPAPTVNTPIGYCQNSTATQLSATAIGGNSLLWYGSASTGGTSSNTAPTPVTISSGTFSYYLSQKDGNGCEGPRAQIDVEITPTLTGTVTGTNAFCITGELNKSTTLTGNPSGGNGVYTYQWQNLAGNISAATTQTYDISSSNQSGNSETYKVVLTSGYCTFTTTASITVTKQGWNDVPSVTGNTPDICGSGTKTLNIVSPSASGTYRWFSDATTLIQTASGASFTTTTLSATTTYYVAREQQVTANLTCQTARTTTIININTPPTTPVIINSANKTSFCNNESSFTLSVTCSSGSGQYRLNNTSWITGNSVSINPASYVANTTFTYDFKCVLNATCESGFSTASISILPVPTAPTILGNTSFCSGSSTTLTANGCTGNVIWSEGTTASTLVVSTAGTYSATCTLNGCTSLASSTQTIVINPIPAAPSISSNDTDNIVCAGASVILTANGCSGSVLWSNNTSGNTLSISSSGTYSATCTLNGCTSLASSTQTIVINPIPAAPSISSDDTDNIVCAGASVILTANGCSGSVLWSNNTSGSTLSVSSSGTYSATCTLNGCTSLASLTQTIVVNPIPAAPSISSDDTDNIVCAGASVILTANGCSGSVLWSNNTSGSTLSVSSSGTYSATCTLNGCTSLASSTQTIVINPIPAAPSISSDDTDNIVCAGASVILTANGCSGSVLWSNNTSGSTLSVSSSGTYSATCTLNGCTSLASSTQTIVVNPIPAAPSISSDDTDNIVCAGASVILTANGCSGSVLWSNNTSGNTLSISSSGTYSATCTLNGCTSLASSTQTIVINPIPSFTTQPLNQTNCKSANSTFTGTVNISSTLQWEYRTSSTGTFANVGGSATGITLAFTASSIGSTAYPHGSEFRLKATSNGCTTYSNIVVLSVNSITGDFVDQVKCNGSSTTFDLSAFTIVGTISSYQWEVSTSASSGFVSVSGVQFSGANSSVLAINPISSTDGVKYYRCKIVFTNTVSGACTISTNSGKLTVTTISPPTVSGATVICQGQNTTLTATGCTGTITWNTGVTGSTLNVSTAGTYSATCTLNGCTSLASSTQTIVVNPIPAAPSISSDDTDNIVCAGASVILTANGCSGSVLWSNNTSGNTLSVSSSGTYSATCTLNGCTSLASSTQTIVVNPIPTAPTISGNSSICAGNSTTLTANGCTGNVIWSEGTTASTLVVSSAGTYSATCTQNGCTSLVSFTKTISLNPIPNAPTISGISKFCSGGSITLTANGCSGAISWNNGTSASTLPVSTSGTYTATCTENSCISASSVPFIVSENSLPTIVLGAISNICNAAISFDLPYTATTNSPDKFSISSTMSGFVAIVDQSLINSPLTINIPSNQTGTHTFTLTIKNTSSTCNNSQTFNLTVLPILNAGSIETSSSAINCAGYNAGVISSIALAVGGKAAYVYQWQSSTDGTNYSDIPSEIGTTFDPPSLTETTYYRRKVSDACGEIKYSNIHQITIVPDPQITITDATDKVICSGNNLNLSATILGGSGTCTPTWQSSSTLSGTYLTEQVGGLTFTQNLTNTTTTPLVKYYRVVYACSGAGSGSCNQSISAIVKVTVNALPTVPTVNGGGTICAGTSTTLIASGCSGNISWSNGASTSSISISIAGSYMATCTNSCGTSGASSAILVNVTTTNPPVLSGSTSICGGQSATLTASGCVGNVTWSNGSTGTSIAVSPVVTTSYTATCTANGCTSLSSESVTVTVAPMIDFTVSTIADLCNSATSFSLPYTLSLGSPDKYSITSTMPGFVAINEVNLPISPISVSIPAGQTGTFSFTLTLKISSTGCSKTQTFSVTILPILNAGSIETSSSAINCAGYNAGVISSIALAVGGKAAYVYQWQSSTDGTNYSDIPSEIGTTFDPPSLTETTYYRRKVSDACGEIKYSNIHQITIVPDPQITITDATDKVICSGNNLNLSATILGGSGTCTPTWQSSSTLSGTYLTEQVGGLTFTQNLTNTTTTPLVKYYRVVYACSGAGSGSCNQSISAIVKVTVNALPTVPTVNGGGTICAGTSTTLIASGCSGNISWSNGASTSSISISIAGSYMATCTNSCGTSGASSAILVNVTTTNPPVLSGSTSICGGQSATLTASGCAGNVTWSNGSTGTSIAVSPVVTTSYTATCTANGCTSLSSESVTVTVAPTIDFTVSTIADLCNSATSFSLPYTLSLGSPDKYSITSTMPGFVAINEVNLPISPISVSIPAGQTGTFSFTLTLKISSTGCSKTQTFSVTILPILNAGSIETSSSAINCAGYNAGVISSIALAVGGKAAYVYQWQSSTDGTNYNDIPSEIGTTFDPPALTETTYYRRKVSDACGEIKYSNIHQITIVPDPQITITDATDKVICSGNNLNLSATILGGSGTCTPTWQSSSTLSGTYLTEQVGGLSFSQTITNASATPLIKYYRVVYACSGAGSGSCNQSISAVVKVTVNALPTVPTVNVGGTICAGTSTTLTASGCNGNISWSNGATTSSISVSIAGSYMATCTNSCGTSGASSAILVNVTTTNPPVLSGSTSICGGQSATLTASGCVGNVTWSNGSTGTSIAVSPVVTTSYTATCTANGCTSLSSESVTVTVAPTIDFTVSTIADLCNTATSFSLPYTLSFGSPDKYSITSTMPGFVAINEVNLPISPISVSIPAGQTGTFSFTLTLKISNTGCSKTQTFSVTILPILNAGSIETSSSAVNCAGYNAGVISSIALAVGGKAAYVYQWQSSTDGTNYSDIPSEIGTTFDPPALTETTYYRRKVSDACGEIKYSNIHQITIVPDPQITITDATDKVICSGNNLNLSATILGGSGTCTPTWQSSSTLSGTYLTEQVGGLTFTQNLTNTTTTPLIKYYRVVYACSGAGSGSCNQSISAIVKVTVNYIPNSPTISPLSITICPTQTTTLTASGCTGLITWANGQTGSTLSVASAGTYAARCTVSNCTSNLSAIANVTVASGGTPVSPPVIAGAATICNGQSTNLTATGCSGLVTWVNGNTGTVISISPSLTITYTATCYDGTCTSDVSNQIIVTVNNYPTITTQPKNEADCDGNSVTFTVTVNPATSYQWQRKISNGIFENINLATTNSLTISNVGSAIDPNLTQYQVIVSNGLCAITSNIANLTVNSIAGSLADKTICNADNVTFDLTTITTTGEIISYQWQKRVGTSGTWNDISGATTTSLSINNATNDDEQYYRCKINFKVGTSTCARYTTDQDSNGAKLTVLTGSTPTISGNNIVCKGISTKLTANSCDGAIAWSSGQTTASITVIPVITTSYIVTWTSTQCGFTATSEPYIVTVNTTLAPEIITYNVITPETLVFSVRSTVANATITWYNKATGGIATTTAPYFTVVGTYTYWVTQTDPLTGCESARIPVIGSVLDYFHITIQPKNQPDCKGNSVYMDVTAVAPTNAFTYQWQRKRPNETDFSNLTEDANGIRGWYSKTMLVSNVGNDNNPHLTQYRCIVSNGNQSITSNSSTLTVNLVVGLLPNIGACLGKNAEFYLPSYFAITGDVLNYQWQTREGTSGAWTNVNDGNGISGSTSDGLRFTNITNQMGVYYRCLVKFNTQGFECIEPTDPAKLIVSGYPPAPLAEGIFYCQNAKAVKLKVLSITQNTVWYEQATGGIGSTTTPTPSTDVAGIISYYVTDRTDEGCESPRTQLKVDIGATPPAPINTTPINVNEGTILTFSAEGTPKENQILHWFTSLTGTSFTTESPTFATSGTYTRYVAQLSAFGCLGPRTAINASIIPSLKFTKQPISQADCDGNSVTFSVTATGPTIITYQWQRLRPNETIFINIANETTNSLKISNVGNVDNPNLTKYRCVIKDDKSTTISEESILTVNEIKGLLPNISICDGKSTKLSFESLTFTGEIVSYQWQKNDGTTYLDIPTDIKGIANVNEVATYRGKITFLIDNRNTCLRYTDNLSVVAKPVPSAPKVVNSNVCLGNKIDIEKTIVATETFLWYESETSEKAEKTIPKIDLSKIGKTSYFVSQITQFGCESERKSFEVSILSVPSKPSITDLNYCRNAPSTTLTASTEKENTLLWYETLTVKTALAKTPIPSTQTDGTTNYYVSAKNTEGCESERIVLKVIVTPCIATFENNFNNCLQVSTDSVKGNKWYDLYDKTGRLYASVNPNGLNLGKVSISIRHYGRGSAAIPATQNLTQLMARYVDFQSSLVDKFVNPVSLRIYYTNDELSEYKTATNLPNLTINDFNIVHYDGIKEDCGFENNDNFNDGNSVVIYKNVVGNQLAKDFFYLQFDVNEFSENGATANDFTEITFNAKQNEDKTINLNWQTKFEIKAKKFILQRSADCKTWATIGEVKANGVGSNYEILDPLPLGGKSCYRLIFIDQDGTKKYLDPVEFNFADITPICTVFPNPSTNSNIVNLYIRNIKEKEIKLYDILGKEFRVDWKKDDFGIIRISPEVFLPIGTHFVVVIDDNGKRCIQKIIINP